MVQKIFTFETGAISKKTPFCPLLGLAFSSVSCLFGEFNLDFFIAFAGFKQESTKAINRFV